MTHLFVIPMIVLATLARATIGVAVVCVATPAILAFAVAVLLRRAGEARRAAPRPAVRMDVPLVRPLNSPDRSR